MVKFIIFISLILLISCKSNSTTVKNNSYEIIFDHKAYAATLDEEAQDLILSSDFLINKKKLNLFLNDENLIYMSNYLGYDNELLVPNLNGPVSSVAILPYYGLYALRIQQAVKQGAIIQSEICPIESKYLMILVLFKEKLPRVGCIVEKKVQG